MRSHPAGLVLVLVPALLAMAFLWVADTAQAGATRLPDWISVSPSFSSDAQPIQGADFPSAEDRASWQDQGHGYVDLLWRVRIHIERSGIIETRVEVVRHFVSDSGISQGGNLELWADAWRDRLELEAAYSVSPGAPPVLVDPDTIEVVSGSINGVFSDFQQVVLPIPGLRVGSNAGVIGTRRFQSYDLPLDWSWMTGIGSDVPVKRIELEITVAPGAPGFVWHTNDPDLECTGDDRHLSCTRSDVPAVQMDPQVASYVDLMPHFLIRGAQTWGELQRKVDAMVEEAAALTPELREMVAELGLDTSDTDRQKLWKLLRFAADEIRYVSLAHGDATVVPHPASLTLARRFGDCKDKVTLLVAMGRVAGLDIFPVLTSSDRKLLENVLGPSSGYFDHMIACMLDEEGLRVCVDPTQAYSGLALPPQLFGAISLPVGILHTPMIENLPAREIGWTIDLKREVELRADESVGVRDVRRYSGPGAAGLRTQILGLSAADRDAWVSHEYRDSHGAIKAPDFVFRGLTDASAPFEIEFSTASPGAHRLDEGEYYRYDPWLVSYARGMISTNRHHPYVLLGFRYTAEEVVDHCCGDIAFAGPDLHFESRYGSLQRTSEIVDGRLTMKTVFELPTAVIPVEEIPLLESFILQSVSESTQWISWKPAD